MRDLVERLGMLDINAANVTTMFLKDVQYANLIHYGKLNILL